MEKKHCANCGAPITSEVCSYCHANTGVESKYADMEYPVIECKEANINFFNVVFPMIFALLFGSVGIIFPLIGALSEDTNYAGIGIFAIIGIIAFIIAMIPLVRYVIISLCGKEVEATVYGYMDDNVLLNNSPAQIVKLLVSTNDGLKFILYQLGDIKHPFKINSKIKLKVYKNLFHIVYDKKYYF